MEIFAEPQGRRSSFSFSFFFTRAPSNLSSRSVWQRSDRALKGSTAVDDTYCLLLEVDAMDTTVCTLYFSRAIVEQIEVDERYRIPDIPKEFARV